MQFPVTRWVVTRDDGSGKVFRVKSADFGGGYRGEHTVGEGDSQHGAVASQYAGLRTCSLAM